MFKKREPEDVDYSEGNAREHCGICRHFLPDAGACRLVKGHILARMWCKLFSRKDK